MSPEQVRGAHVDHRSDIFALGCVLYEMLAGRRAFARANAPETMSAILRDDIPEWPETGRHVPEALDRLVRETPREEARRAPAVRARPGAGPRARGGRQAFRWHKSPYPRQPWGEDAAFRSDRARRSRERPGLGCRGLGVSRAEETVRPSRFASRSKLNPQAHADRRRLGSAAWRWGRSQSALTGPASCFAPRRRARAASCCERSTATRPRRCRGRRAGTAPSSLPTASGWGSSPTGGSRRSPSRSSPSRHCVRLGRASAPAGTPNAASSSAPAERGRFCGCPPWEASRRP